MAQPFFFRCSLPIYGFWDLCEMFHMRCIVSADDQFVLLFQSLSDVKWTVSVPSSWCFTKLLFFFLPFYNFFSDNTAFFSMQIHFCNWSNACMWTQDGWLIISASVSSGLTISLWNSSDAFLNAKSKSNCIRDYFISVNIDVNKMFVWYGL